MQAELEHQPLETTETAALTVPVPRRLDFRAAHRFRVTLLHAVSGADAVTVDLSAVERIDAAGIAVLVGAARRAARTGVRLRTTGWTETATAGLAAQGLTRWLRRATA